MFPFDPPAGGFFVKEVHTLVRYRAILCAMEKLAGLGAICTLKYAVVV